MFDVKPSPEAARDHWKPEIVIWNGYVAMSVPTRTYSSLDAGPGDIDVVSSYGIR